MQLQQIITMYLAEKCIWVVEVHLQLCCYSSLASEGFVAPRPARRPTDDARLAYMDTLRRTGDDARLKMLSANEASWKSSSPKPALAGSTGWPRCRVRATGDVCAPGDECCDTAGTAVALCVV